MAIYGTALLSICVLTGVCVGRTLGSLCGLDADIGGVGIGMLLLIVGGDYLHHTGRMKPPTESGVVFWSSIYIPIVVAMAANQNVLAAVSGGFLALLVGAITVVVCFGIVGFLARTGTSKPNDRAAS